MPKKKKIIAMKLAIGLIAVLFGAVAYFVTFSAFWESWFPYYYHEYVSYWFYSGLVCLLVIPVLLSVAKKLLKSQGDTFSYRTALYKSVIGVNVVVVVACIGTFSYMLSHGVFFGGNGASTYSIVPDQ